MRGFGGPTCGCADLPIGYGLIGDAVPGERFCYELKQTLHRGLLILANELPGRDSFASALRLHYFQACPRGECLA